MHWTGFEIILLTLIMVNIIIAIHMGRERVFSEKKILHHFRQAFWYGKGVRYHQKKIQNRDIGGF